MNSSRAESSLRNLKTSSLPQQHIGHGNAHIFKGHLGMTMRCIVISKDSKHAFDRHSRSIHRNENHRLLFMRGRIEIGLTHENRNPAARVSCPGSPPLPAVNYIMIPVTYYG